MNERQSSKAGGVPAPSVPLRDQHGAITKRVILEAARALFGASGYVETSVKDIAGEAGVAVQTVYNAFGSKAGVALALADLVDEEAGVHPLFQALATSEDPREVLELFARIRRRIRERCGDVIDILRAGARVDDAVGAAWAEGLRRRHAGISRAVSRLAEADQLKPELDATRAADILAALAVDEICDVMVRQRDWSYDEYEQWLATTMKALVLR